MDLVAPIVAVTVHPDRARVTRRGTVTLAAGPNELVVAGLPETLLDDSVRVAGRTENADQAVRVVGVDVVRRDLVAAPDERVRAAEQAVREAERALAAIDGADAGDAAREQLLQRLALRSGDRLARALAEGAADPARVAEVSGAVAAQLVEVAAERRAHAERRVDAEHARAAAQSELDRLRASGRTRRDAVIAVEADVPCELALELTYVVHGAGWTLRLRRPDRRRPARSRSPGTAWSPRPPAKTGPRASSPSPRRGPASRAPCRSWSRGGSTCGRPLRRCRSPPRPRRRRVRHDAPREGGGGAGRRRRARRRALWPSRGGSPRPTAVPADGTPHRTTVATATLDARLDHVVAPAVDPAAHLRATVVNTGGHALLAGPLSAFVDGDFVGSTHIDTTAPGAELELHLGVDDRVAVERELMERTPHRALLGGKISAVERWRIEVHNGRPAPVRLVVRERVPVSRHPDVQVVDVDVKPEPAERDELGRLEWTASVEPNGTWEANVRFGVRHARGVPVVGWR